MQQGPGIVVTFLYYFSVTTLIVLVIMTQGLGASLEARLTYQWGILFGFIAGMYGAYLNRSVTWKIPVERSRVFQQTLDQALQEMGFTEQGQVEDFKVYGKSAVRSLFSGKMLININTNEAIVMGRSSYINRLKRYLDSLDP